MNLLESQNILLTSLKFFGFFPIKFPGKFRKLKNHLYNFVISIGLITTFAIVGRVELNHILDSSTEKESLIHRQIQQIFYYKILYLFIFLIFLKSSSSIGETSIQETHKCKIVTHSYKWTKESKQNTMNQFLTIRLLKSQHLLNDDRYFFYSAQPWNGLSSKNVT
jgi:hypothetical protein